MDRHFSIKPQCLEREISQQRYWIRPAAIFSSVYMLPKPIVGFVVHHTHYKRIRLTTPNLKPQYKHFTFKWSTYYWILDHVIYF